VLIECIIVIMQISDMSIGGFSISKREYGLRICGNASSFYSGDNNTVDSTTVEISAFLFGFEMKNIS